LSNFAFLTILTVLVAALMLHVVHGGGAGSRCNGGDITGCRMR